MVRKLIAGSIVGCSLALSGVATAFATGQPGAPGVTCFSSSATAQAPGNSMSAAGSVFNPSGQAGTVYAGNPGTPSLANGSANAISQYDVACLQVTTH
jgi:hypothetical protein